MIWKLASAVAIALSVILTLGCNSSAKHVQMAEFTHDTELIATLAAVPEQPLGLERPIMPQRHSPFAIPSEAGADLKILAVTPDSRIDYKIAVATPAPGIDYKMLTVPNRGQSPHAIRKLEILPGPEIPSLPWKPKRPATE